MSWRPSHMLRPEDYLAIMDAWLNGNHMAMHRYGAKSDSADGVVALCLIGWEVSGGPLCVDHLTYLVESESIPGGLDAVEVAWQAIQSIEWWDEFVEESYR